MSRRAAIPPALRAPASDPPGLGGGDRSPPFAEIETVLRELLPGRPDALETAARRVARLVVTQDAASAPPVAFLYAAAALAAVRLDGRVKPLVLEPLVHTLGRRAGVGAEVARHTLLATAVAEVAAGDEEPTPFARRVLHLVCGLAPATGASAWSVEGGANPLRLVDAVGSHARHPPRQAATRALLVGEGRRTDVAAAVPGGAGVVLARPVAGSDVTCLAFLELVAGVLGHRLGRGASGTAPGARPADLVAAGERRLLRLGLDLHDGPAQTIAALAADAQIVRSRLRDAQGVPPPVVSFVEELVERLQDLGAEIRDLAESLESRSVIRRPLVVTLQRELRSLASRSSVTTSLDVTGELVPLTNSQQIALVRVVQEALANVRDHSRARHVSIVVRHDGGRTCLEVRDDGCGFDVAVGRERALREGRLGLAGMAERLALLGGTLDVESRPGGPTTIRAAVPDWPGPASAADR